LAGDAMTKEEPEIFNAIKSLCPNRDIKYPDYYTSFISEVVKVFEELNNYSSGKMILSYPESIRVKILNNVVEQIKKDLIEDKHNYLWRHDEPKDDYERGVLNAIRLIQFRVHCICDD
jgi:hypothetical protein